MYNGIRVCFIWKQVQNQNSTGNVIQLLSTIELPILDPQNHKILKDSPEPRHFNVSNKCPCKAPGDQIHFYNFLLRTWSPGSLTYIFLKYPVEGWAPFTHQFHQSQRIPASLFRCCNWFIQLVPRHGYEESVRDKFDESKVCPQKRFYRTWPSIYIWNCTQRHQTTDIDIECLKWNVINMMNRKENQLQSTDLFLSRHRHCVA
jgi:hypothetical protein